MMTGWAKHANVGAWSTHMSFRAFVLEHWCRAYSVTRRPGWSVWFGGGKNGLRRVRHGAPGLVRSACAAGARSALWAVSDLPGAGSSAPVLPSLLCGEARAAGVSARKRAAYAAICTLRGQALSQQHDQGCGQRAAPGLANGQAAGEGLYARADRAQWQAAAEHHRHRRGLGARGSRLPHRGQRPGTTPADLVWRCRPQRAQHG